MNTTLMLVALTLGITAGLLCWVLIATHAIGEPASTAPITWADAWKLVAVIAAAIFLGWQAGRESKAPQ